MTTLVPIPPTAAPTLQELEQQEEAISDRLWGEMGTLTLDQVDELCYDRAQLRRTIHVLSHPERKRCEQCGGFLKSVPDEEKYSSEGDNLDEYCCTKCGYTTVECYS
jgi:hypothetical protein